MALFGYSVCVMSRLIGTGGTLPGSPFGSFHHFFSSSNISVQGQEVAYSYTPAKQFLHQTDTVIYFGVPLCGIVVSFNHSQTNLLFQSVNETEMRNGHNADEKFHQFSSLTGRHCRGHTHRQ